MISCGTLVRHGTVVGNHCVTEYTNHMIIFKQSRLMFSPQDGVSLLGAGSLLVIEKPNGPNLLLCKCSWSNDRAATDVCTWTVHKHNTEENLHVSMTMLIFTVIPGLCVPLKALLSWWSPSMMTFQLELTSSNSLHSWGSCSLMSFPWKMF